MPLIFALLHPSISPDVIRCVLPPGVGTEGYSSPAGRQGRQLLQAACYRCRNVLTHAVEGGLTAEVVAALLQAGQSRSAALTQLGQSGAVILFE